MFFITTITWEAPTIDTYVLYLVQIVENKKKDNKTEKGKSLT